MTRISRVISAVIACALALAVSFALVPALELARAEDPAAEPAPDPAATDPAAKPAPGAAPNAAPGSAPNAAPGPAPGPASKPAAKRDPHHHSSQAKPSPGVGAKHGQGKPYPGPPGSKNAPSAPMPYPGGLIERNAKRLGVDAATVKKMRATFDAARSEGDTLRKKIGTEQITLRGMLEKDVPDEAAVMAQADKIGAMSTDIRKLQLRAILAVRAMLTPEQRAELNKIRAEGQKKK